jgi:hypothetical protein
LRAIEELEYQLEYHFLFSSFSSYMASNNRREATIPLWTKIKIASPVKKGAVV